MTMARFQTTIVDDKGNIQSGASVEVRREEAGAPLATIYSDREGTTPLGNPMTAGSDGFAAFHVAGGAYRITATKGAFSRTWRYAAVGILAELDDLTGLDLGLAVADGLDVSDATVIATGATEQRTLADRFSDTSNVKDFGAIGDGAVASPPTDDTAAITAADAVAQAKFVPDGIYATTLAASALDGPYWGRGQIQDTDGHLRAPWFSAIKAAPSVEGSDSSVITAFDGDLSKSFIQAEVRVTGAATLGQPATGYKYNPELAPFRLFLYNESGHNESTTGDDGRTNLAGHQVNIAHAGLGDCVAFVARVFVAGDASSATDWPADPSGGAFHCGITAGHDNVNLNPIEMALEGGAFDVSGFGYVVNMTRNVGTADRGQYWGGFLARSRGTHPIDVGVSLSGDFDFGIDLVHGDYTNNAAIIMKPDQRIYFEGVADTTGQDRYPSALGDTYLEYNSANSFIGLVVNSQSVIQASSLQLLSPLSIRARGGTAIPAGGTAGAGLQVSSATNFGIFFGSGKPTLQAAKGSLYLRSDGSGTSGDNARLWVNTDGGTTWTGVITVA